MSFAPLRSTHRNLYSWFAAPDLFASRVVTAQEGGLDRRRRGHGRLVTLTVYLNAEATVELLAAG